DEHVAVRQPGVPDAAVPHVARNCRVPVLQPGHARGVDRDRAGRQIHAGRGPGLLHGGHWLGTVHRAGLIRGLPGAVREDRRIPAPEARRGQGLEHDDPEEADEQAAAVGI
ncbi:hypothetical protein IWW51_005543, partial [Coemansia sp. RSA 2702]